MAPQPALLPADVGDDDDAEYAEHSPFFHALCKVVCGSCPDCNRRSLECEPVEFGERIREVLSGHDYRCTREHCHFTRRLNDETIAMAGEWAVESEAWQYYPPVAPRPATTSRVGP